MIWWILIGLAVITLGGWGAFALWLLPYPDTSSLIPSEKRSVMTKV